MKPIHLVFLMFVAVMAYFVYTKFWSTQSASGVNSQTSNPNGGSQNAIGKDPFAALLGTIQSALNTAHLFAQTQPKSL